MAFNTLETLMYNNGHYPDGLGSFGSGGFQADNSESTSD